MHDIITRPLLDTDTELDRIAKHYRSAGGAGVQMLNALGGKAEGLLDQLPANVRDGLTGATERALRLSVQAAQGSRRAVPDQNEWVNAAVTTAMGAAGGFGGLPGALVELPATTTMLLRAIQGVAAGTGFDPATESVQFDCVRVFSAAGPLDFDDGADLGFLSARMTLTGGAMQKLIATVAPKLATALGQKLAAQTVPILGAVAGAGTNFAYTRYYQQIAHVQFGLRRLAVDADLPQDELVLRLRSRMSDQIS
ncbi:EcsC protein family protein [Falsiruegeria litorea R37]|uniref:EcsC protein family protein n=1 Tax=Falsiruegeria litorea R37 TaxID=1200284 RepID=A0A1Y5T4E6_9RHOB|nr:EcsC family protein [Falsiruegeria litorea]SLN54986.1 EcsC protein family protein [Falsiruegeria litorea R37]